MANPAMPTAIMISTESTTPAAAKATVFAARKRRRSGAASSELVMVRWRHSPVIPTTARSRMKSPLASELNTSVSTSSLEGSERIDTSTVMRSEIPIATPASAANVRVVRSLISSASSSGFTLGPR